MFVALAVVFVIVLKRLQFISSMYNYSLPDDNMNFKFLIISLKSWNIKFGILEMCFNEVIMLIPSVCTMLHHIPCPLNQAGQVVAFFLYRWRN